MSEVTKSTKATEVTKSTEVKTIEVKAIEVKATEAKKYYKALNKNLTHHGFVYKLGLNVDVLPFNPTGSCLPGGLYYTDLEHIAEYFEHYGDLVAEVEPVGQIYLDPEIDLDGGKVVKWKTDKLIIKSIEPIERFMAKQSNAFKLAACKVYGLNIKYIIWPTEEMQRIAVQSNWGAHQYIRNPTKAITKLAQEMEEIAHKEEEKEHKALVKEINMEYPYLRAMYEAGYTSEEVEEEFWDIMHPIGYDGGR